MSLRDELKIAPANVLCHVGSRTKGAVGQTEIDDYEEVPRGRSDRQVHRDRAYEP